MAKSKEFNEGWWNCLVTMMENGADRQTVESTIRSAGFSYEECLALIKESGNLQNQSLGVVRSALGYEFCDKCEEYKKDVCECERCEEQFCPDCSAVFTQHNQIDYNCCKRCGETNMND